MKANKSILIIDDSESIRELVSITLESSGYQVFKGVNGRDGLNFLDGREVDLVITDLNMPEIDGIEVIKAIRAKNEYASIPVLMLTTDSQLQKKEQARAAGATGWIVKPFVQNKLLEVVKRILR
jgi:two-component system, chemotaxis family, chemotaxis protein CheY